MEVRLATAAAASGGGGGGGGLGAGDLATAMKLAGVLDYRVGR